MSIPEKQTETVGKTYTNMSDILDLLFTLLEKADSVEVEIEATYEDND